MKVVSLLPVVDDEKCIGCKTCERVCPVCAIRIDDNLAIVDEARCRGCGDCEQRCPEYAIAMTLREEPIVAKVSLEGLDYDHIVEMCRKARFHPEQIVCYCTATRAEEVAAAIMRGARSPDEISYMTGIRTGCKVECIQPILRILEAFGIDPKPVPGGWQWYGRTITAWEIPESVKEKYASRGFYFEEDIELLNRIVNAPLQGKE